MPLDRLWRWGLYHAKPDEIPLTLHLSVLCGSKVRPMAFPRSVSCFNQNGRSLAVGLPTHAVLIKKLLRLDESGDELVKIALKARRKQKINQKSVAPLALVHIF